MAIRVLSFGYIFSEALRPVVFFIAPRYNARRMGTRADFAVKKKEKIKEPQDFKVVMLNDDFTSMDFVVDILVLVFHKNEGEANRIMLDIHNKGRGIAGIYALDIAETKVNQVTALAEQNDFPLQCIIEPM
jgi:ATP-dependent Clp protease adaptor protein ClpS